MKKNQLIMSTLLFCGLALFSACSEKDNPAPEPVTPEERVVFEKQFSQDLQAMADQFRLESATQAMSSVKEFINVLDEKALSEQVLEIVQNMVGGLQPALLDDLSDKEKAAAVACLKARFGMTDQDIQTLPGIITIDAYKSIGKMKLAFKDGKLTITNDADAFTIVSTNANNETKTIALKFNDERDGIRFFAARLGGILPIAVQLPKSIGITVTTPKGQILNGTVNLTTIDANKSQYVDFKESGWMADAKLDAILNSRQEAISLYVKHTEDRTFDLSAAFEIMGKEMARLEVSDMHDAYTDEEINSEAFKEMREMGAFFSGAYDVLKALKGKSVDNIVIAVNDNMVVEGKVDDIAKSLLALGNVRKLYGTQPGFETIDKYTQELNSLIHFTVRQKNTGITAQGKLLTAVKNNQNGEYQPVLALQFKGETEPLAMFDRMSQADQENYKMMLDSFTPLVNEISEMLIVARKKGEAVVSAVKERF